MSNNPPEVLVGLTKAQAEFLLKMCDSNMSLGLSILMIPESLSKMGAEELVELLDNLKGLKAATEKGLKG